jgi:hypothetical protein
MKRVAARTKRTGAQLKSIIVRVTRGVFCLGRHSYDALDRLVQATYPTSTVTYTLDSMGNRPRDGMTTFADDGWGNLIQETVNGVTTEPMAESGSTPTGRKASVRN